MSHDLITGFEDGLGLHPGLRLAGLRALSFHFEIKCNDQRLFHRLAGLFGPLIAGAPGDDDVSSTHTYEVHAASAGPVCLLLDGAMLAELESAIDAVAWLVWDVTQRAAAATTDHLLLHAGAVQGGDAGVLLPGPSGSGKSTLVAALVGEGLACLSDELVAVSFSPPMLVPYPKPITIKPGSFDVMAQVLASPSAPQAEHADMAAWIGEEWHVGVEDVRVGATGTACEPMTIVLPRYVAGVSTTLRPMSQTEAFVALTVNTVNLDVNEARAVALLGELARGCACFELEYSDSTAACAAVRSVLSG